MGRVYLVGDLFNSAYYVYNVTLFWLIEFLCIPVDSTFIYLILHMTLLLAFFHHLYILPLWLLLVYNSLSYLDLYIKFLYQFCEVIAYCFEEEFFFLYLPYLSFLLNLEFLYLWLFSRPSGFSHLCTDTSEL